jgi:GNAT superfamily N-acetyltransferase
MAEQFRISRYRADDRQRVLDFIVTVHPRAFADRLIQQWSWRYEENPFNREAARYREAHREEVLAHLDRVFSRDRFERFCRKWSIDPHDCRGDEGPYILLMQEGDKLVAMQGSLPQCFMIGGKQRWVSVGCDLAVHPDYRNRGLALPLTNRLLTEHAMMLSWFNASIHRIRSGWRKAVARGPGASGLRGVTEARLTPLVKPLDLGYAVRILTGSRMLAGAAAMTAAAARPLTKMLDRPFMVPGVKVSEIHLPGVELDQLWNRLCGIAPVIAVRDRRFLNWRFAQRPDASYRFVVAMRDSDLIGYLVFRVAEIEGAKWGYLVDFMAEGPTLMPFKLLLRHAESCLMREGAKVIVCDAAPARFRRALMRSGYLPSRARKPIYLSANLNSADPELQVFADVPRWFVTASDGNLELTF